MVWVIKVDCCMSPSDRFWCWSDGGPIGGDAFWSGEDKTTTAKGSIVDPNEVQRHPPLCIHYFERTGSFGALGWSDAYCATQRDEPDVSFCNEEQLWQMDMEQVWRWWPNSCAMAGMMLTYSWTTLCMYFVRFVTCGKGRADVYIEVEYTRAWYKSMGDHTA